MVINHRWTRLRYPAVDGEEQPEDAYLKCLRCGKVYESVGGLPGSWMPFWSRDPAGTGAVPASGTRRQLARQACDSRRTVENVQRQILVLRRRGGPC